MAELEAGLAELASGHGSLYLITGEPGIGKTRLADELGRVASRRNVAVHWGRAWEAGGAPAFWPFIQVLRSIARDADPLAALVAPTQTPIERFQLFDAVVEFLRARTARLIVLDDLHAADPSSLELLQFLVRDLHELPVMIVGTYRDVEARLARDSMQLLARIAREATMLALPRLERDDVATFVALATGRDHDDGRVALIYQQTEGNPLFLRELLNLHGSLRPTDGIREVVRARLALLEPETRQLLEAAAVLGREFAVSPLARIAQIAELDARALVEPAANAGIIEPLEQPPRWRFTHVLLRQGLYDDLPDARRCSLHAAAADELERRAGDAQLAEIAHHRIHAVPHVSVTDAATAALRAADRAIELLAFEDARELYATAERLLAGEPTARRALFEAVLGGAHAYMRNAEVNRAHAECDRAAQIARQLDDGELLARAVLMSAYELVPEVRDSAAIAALEEALARLPPGDGGLRAQCMAQLAAKRHPEPDNEPRIALARDAIAMARRIGDPVALRHTLVGAAIATVLYADPAETAAINQELLRLALGAGDKRVALRSHMFLGGIAYQRGDVETAAIHSHAVRELVAEFGHGRFAWISALLDVFEALAMGRFDEAMRIHGVAEAAVQQDEARGALLAAAPLMMACVMERYTDRAQLEARTRAAYCVLPYDLAGCIAEMLIAKLHGRAGDRDRAAAQLATLRALPIFASVEEPAWLAQLVEACHLVGDRELAARLYAKLLPCAARFAFLGPSTGCAEPPYGRQLGLLAQTLGRHDDAVAHLEDAELRTRNAGMRAHFARLRFELARALTARDQPGDRERAVALESDARAVATELGQTGLLDQFAPHAPSTPPVARPSASRDGVPAFSITRDGDVWVVASSPRKVTLRDSRGMQLLAQLVATPDQELHVLQLVAGDEPSADRGDAGPLLDSTALGAYRQRLLDLREELAEAERFSDLARTERASTEIETLTSELARAVGLGGRDRRASSAAERARTTVQKRLRDAIRKIAAELPDLARHLDQTIHTGTFCGYLPTGRRL